MSYSNEVIRDLDNNYLNPSLDELSELDFLEEDFELSFSKEGDLWN